METLVIIPARGGSKGVPGKNIKLLKGMPLIQYTINAATDVFDQNCIIVSTDSEEIKLSVENGGLEVPFLRPAKLATDTTGSVDVIRHALDYYERENSIEVDTIVLLQPTSPFRSSKHIKEALRLYNQVDMVVSVKETNSNPYYTLFEEDSMGFLQKSKESNFTRRQDCPPVWEYNGAIYILNKNEFLKFGFNIQKKKKYLMGETESLDIDTYLDWKLAEFIIDLHHEY